MKLNKDYVIFELISKERSNYEEPRTGNPVGGLGSYGLKHTQTILFHETNEKNEVVDTYERVIRYMPNQRSIYADVQNDNIPETQQDKIPRLVSKPHFINGLLMVKSNQKNLLEFLRNHPENDANPHLRVNNKQRSIFRERNPVAIAQKQNEQTKLLVKVEGMVFTADFDTKILPIAKYLKIDIDQDAQLILFDVKRYAVDNPREFLELMDSPKVERVSIIENAVAVGILRVEGQRVLWADSRQIVDVPTNYDPIHYLAEVSFDKSYRSVWAEITRLLDKRTNPQKDAEQIEQAPSTVEDSLDKINVSDLFESLKDAGEIVFKVPYYYAGEDRIGKGKEEALRYISENRKLFAVKLMD